MITVIIQVRVQDAFIQAFANATADHMPDRRNAAGNVRFDVYQQQNDPARFIMIEVFDTQETIDAYYKTDGYKAWHQRIAPMLMEFSGADYQPLG